MIPANDIEQVFAVTPREWFLPEEMRPYTHEDRPLPIGHGQTNSQPSTVWRMLEWLDVKPGQKILDVGSGSGWTSALLARLTGTDGHVFAVEKIPELVAFGEQNCQLAGISNASFFPAGTTFGLPEHAPYDRILVSAGAGELPQELIDQLKPGGKIIIPVQYDILEITKNQSGTLDITPHSGFVFVPLK